MENLIPYLLALVVYLIVFVGFPLHFNHKDERTLPMTEFTNRKELDMIWIFMSNRLHSGWRFEFIPNPEDKSVLLNADKGRDHPRFVASSMGEAAGKFKVWYENHMLGEAHAKDT